MTDVLSNRNRNQNGQFLAFEEPMKFVGVKIAEAEVELLDQLAKRRGTNRSELIREAVQQLINDEKYYSLDF